MNKIICFATLLQNWGHLFLQSYSIKKITVGL